MKNLVLISIFLLVFSFLAIAQKTKTIETNLNGWVLDVCIKGDTIISGGNFTSPHNHIALSNVATGSTVSIGDGIPTAVSRVFFLPWENDVLYAGTNAEPYLYRYDFANFTTQSNWVPDTFFQVTGAVYDVDLLPDQVALATSKGVVVLHQSGSLDFYPTSTLGSIALNVEFDHTLSNGKFFVGERTGTSEMDWYEILYEVIDGEKSLVPLGYATALFSFDDMEWYMNKLLILGYVATIPDNGIHVELLTYNGAWASFTNGDDCPYLHRMSVYENRIFVTGIFNNIKGIPLGPVVAEYNGSTWVDPFAPPTSGIGYAIATEPNGKWTVFSGDVTQTESSAFTQLLVFGSEIPTYTGIETSENLLDLEVSLFPNPANDHILIEAPVNAPVAIYNLMGQIVYTGITNTRMEIDLPAGQYIARVQNEDATVNKVFIVVH